MQTRPLGKSELHVPVVIFGAWAVGGWNWGGSDDDEAVRAIQAAIDRGMSAIDTAPVYGFGRSERVVGRALVGRRDRAIVMTKVGLRWDDEGGDFFFQADDGGVVRRVHRSLRPASVKREVEQSLQRLGVDVLDLVQVHWPDPRTPIAETMGALLDLKVEGKLRAIGVSNYPLAMLEEAADALGDVPLASTQPKYSLVAREAEREILPWCARHDVGAVVYSPLEQGLLTGKVTAERRFDASDGRAKRGTFTPENRKKVNDVLDRVVRPIAERHGATLAQVAIAWTVAQRGVTSAIVGARTVAQVEENAKAGELLLADAELATLRKAFEALALDGGPAGLLKRIVKRAVQRWRR